MSNKMFRHILIQEMAKSVHDAKYSIDAWGEIESGYGIAEEILRKLETLGLITYVGKEFDDLTKTEDLLVACNK